MSCGRATSPPSHRSGAGAPERHVPARPAADLARRLLAEGDATPEGWVSRGFRAGLSRPPSDAERGVGAVPRNAAAPFGTRQSPAPDEHRCGPHRFRPGALQPERVHLCRLTASRLRALRPARHASRIPGPGGGGLGLSALATCCAPHIGGRRRAPPGDPPAPRPPHFAPGPPRSSGCSWSSACRRGPVRPQAGARQDHGKKLAIDVFNGNPGPLMKSPFAFRQYGESGAWVCEKYPNVAAARRRHRVREVVLHGVERPRARGSTR